MIFSRLKQWSARCTLVHTSVHEIYFRMHETYFGVHDFFFRAETKLKFFFSTFKTYSTLISYCPFCC